MRNIGLIVLFLSLIPLAFLIYSLLNRAKLNISLVHPRILVEFILFILFIISGVWLILK
jgi:hypothetical protein